jgi:hypothetical protein
MYLSLKLLFLFNRSLELGLQSVVVESQNLVVTLQLFGFSTRAVVLEPHRNLSRLESHHQLLLL